MSSRSRRRQSAEECKLQNKTVFDNKLFHGVRRVYCRNFERNASVIGFYRSNDLNKVAVAFSNSSLTVWNVLGFPDIVLVQAITGFRGWVHHCAWSLCDNFILLVCDTMLYIYAKLSDALDFDLIAEFRPHQHPVSGVLWVSTNKTIDASVVRQDFAKKKCGYTFMTSSYDGTLCYWKMQDVIDGKYASNQPQRDHRKIWDSNVMSNTIRVAECCRMMGKRQDMATPDDLPAKVGHSGKVTCMDCDVDGRRIISGGMDKKILLWDTPNGVVIKVFSRESFHQSCILCVRWSYEANMFASSCKDSSVYVWSTKYDIPLLSLKGHSRAVDNLLFINNHKLLSSGRDSYFLVWDVRAGGVVDSERKHGKSVVIKNYLHKVKPKMSGWINSLSCTPEGLDFAIIGSNMKESLYLFSPKYIDPEWLALPLYKKIINYFSRHTKTKRPALKKRDVQLVRNCKKSLDSSKVKKVVKAPTWNESQAKKKFLRMNSWSWNQHLIDYGEDLSKPKPRKKSVIDSIRRRFSKVNDSCLVEKSKHNEAYQSAQRKSRLLGRGYSTEFDTSVLQAPRLQSSVSAVFDPFLIDIPPSEEYEGGNINESKRGSVWKIMEDMEMDALQIAYDDKSKINNKLSPTKIKDRSKVYAVE